MKRMILLSLLSAICLTACKSDSVPDEIYSEVLEEDDAVDINEITATLMNGLNARYTLNEENVVLADSLFSESGHFINDFNNWKTSVEENNNTVSQDNLYLNPYINDTQAYYEKARDFGLNHGILYTNGKKTGLQPSMKEITPLIEGQEILESTETSEESLVDNNIFEESKEEIIEETTENVMSDEEYKAYLDELFSQEPDYKVYTLEQLEEDLLLCEDKELLVDYFNNNFITIFLGDWGDYEPTEEELRYDNIYYTGYDDLGNGIIDKETWDNYSLEEAREHIKNILIYNYDSYNAYLLEEYELMNSDEYKQQFIDSRRTAKEDFERLKEQYGIVDETETVVYEMTDEYESWRKYNEEYINYIDSHDFENPVFSAVIQEDENGYYIPWAKIYELADVEGRLTDYLEFVAYGETIKVEMPEAPKSYYSDKIMSMVNWEISVDNAGTKRLEISLRMPDKDGNQILVMDLTEDNKLVYNSTVTNIIFK